ncbi:MAG TPA: malto-oligosyltrehalose trehalohydrolase [Candidatus Limnocylindria bacterium]|nr:malto-oligosyltrehalose trehalohydrolase [Candidatus Limnocylindria bacterium]
MSVPRLAVWAPNAERVEACIGGGRLAMTPQEGGWWQLPREMTAGTDYGFSLDGGPSLPDPRSPWQPSGIEGPSRTLDHDAFAWTDAGWRAPPLGAGAVYELHVGTFTPGGTFDTAAERLADLAALGVTHLELMPVAEFSGRHGWGYDGVDLYAPHHAYGGPEGMKRFVDAAHAHGLAVICDVVYNHLGPAGNHLAKFGPYFTDRYSTPWGSAINYDDRGSEEVRRFVIDNALMWLRDYHADGLRLDAVHTIIDTSALHILEEIGHEVRRLELAVGRPLLVTVETDRNDPRLVRSTDAGGLGLDAAWNDDFHHALHALLTGERDGYYADFGEMKHLAEALQHGWVFRGGFSAERERRHGREPMGVPGVRFIGYSQNHDQVGNRARGERISQLVGIGRAKIAAAVVLTSPFVPLLFAGEEWAASTPFPYFSDHADPQLAEAVRTGRQEEFAAFGWDSSSIPDPQDPATFQAAVLRWEERDRGTHRDMLEWYRALLALRQVTPALLDPRLTQVDCDHEPEAGWFAIRRGGISIIFNLGPEPVTLPASGELLLASGPRVAMDGEGLRLPPEAVAIVGSRP